MRTEKFRILFDFAPKSTIKASDGLDKGNFPFYTSSAILKKRIDNAQHFTKALIFGTGGSASVHFADKPFATSTDCIVAVTKREDLNIKFVYYYLFGSIHLLERGFKGAGLKHISKRYIENLDIPVLPIETQNKIVSVLEKASSLILKRNENIELLNELLRATFLDMFGNIASLKKTHNSVPLGTYLSVKHGFAFKSEYFDEEGEYILLTPGNFNATKGYKDRDEKRKFYKGKIPEGYILHKGDMLIAMTEQAPGLLGSPLIVPENNKFLHNQRLGLIELKDEKVDKIFLFYLFNTNFIRSIIHARAVGAKVRHTSPTKIENIEVIFPNYALQKKFSSYAKNIESHLLKVEFSKNQIEILFSSILQKAFKGQLNFNVDFELDTLVKEIDLQKKENDLSKIVGTKAYLQRLVNKLNNQEFKEKEMYDKAKHGIFQLMSGQQEDRKVIQKYNKNNKSIQLTFK